MGQEGDPPNLFCTLPPGRRVWRSLKELQSGFPLQAAFSQPGTNWGWGLGESPGGWVCVSLGSGLTLAVGTSESGAGPGCPAGRMGERAA